MKTLSDWLAYYKRHTGEEFSRKEPFQFFSEPENGFCEYLVDRRDIYIWQLCGNLKYWVNIAYTTARRLKLRSIAAFIVRKPKPFIRALGFRLAETETRNGETRYRAANERGETLTATPYGDRYIFTWMVKNDEI